MSNPKVLFKTLMLRCLGKGEMPQIVLLLRFPAAWAAAPAAWAAAPAALEKAKCGKS
jgi:hypothetical protein